MGNRVSLTDGSGAWFDTDSAVLFKESTRWDGRNQISVPTGSQWNHEWLYFTKSGRWVLHQFSSYQGSTESYEQIDESSAVAWLILNERFDGEQFEKLPASVRDSVQADIAAAEI